MTVKETFDLLMELSLKNILITGYCQFFERDGKFVIGDFDYINFHVRAGGCSEDLIIDCFLEDDQEWPQIDKEGCWSFEALLNYSPAQIGEYPPPNIEIPEYVMIEYSEFKFVPTIQSESIGDLFE